MLRSVAEYIFRFVTFRRRIPRGLGRGKIIVNAGVGGLKYLKPAGLGMVDPSLIRSAVTLVGKGDVVWDIGANLGLFSVVASARSGPEGEVLAFEADISASRCLQATTKLLDRTVHSKIEVIACAVASSPSIVSFVLARRSSACNYIEGFGTAQAGGVQQRVSVIAVSLDWMLSRRAPPNVVKIDVEGAEVEVLKGASTLLSEVRPSVIIEVGSENSEYVSRLFHSHNYVLYDADSRAGLSTAIQSCAWNTLAIPAERAAGAAAGKVDD